MGLVPAAKSIDPKEVLDPAEVRVGGIQRLTDAAKTVLNEKLLRLVAPEKRHKGGDQRSLRGCNISRKHHQGVFTQNRAWRINDLSVKLPRPSIEQQLLLVGHQDIAEPVLKLSPRRAGRSRLGDDVAPDSKQQCSARVGTGAWPPDGGAILGHKGPVG